ncbi:MAG TPA: hypothetical protein PK400_12085, partial [Phycisphaerales bacterium]|nr:hypothetical protein [Phycisphaerales bacterium]HRQ76746.1 hypothetical protein [Phycisphaerales bacterium]
VLLQESAQSIALVLDQVQGERSDSVGHIARDYVTVAIIDQNTPITQFVRHAHLWKKYAGDFIAHAFDEFYPGIAGAGGCLLDNPLKPVVINILGGSMTIAAREGNVSYCAITDSGSGAAHSDARLNNAQSVVTFDFDPPVTAFYTYYGSLAINQTATMHLYSALDGAHMGSITTPTSTDNALASGHGFTSSIPVERIEFTATETGSVLVGAFTGLLSGEPSLGTVNIPSYPGPSGSNVQLDFALVFANVCPADITGNKIVDVSDLLVLLGAWGMCPDPSQCPADLNGDGVVNVSDLLVLLGNWGPCS